MKVRHISRKHIVTTVAAISWTATVSLIGGSTLHLLPPLATGLPALLAAISITLTCWAISLIVIAANTNTAQRLAGNIIRTLHKTYLFGVEHGVALEQANARRGGRVVDLNNVAVIPRQAYSNPKPPQSRPTADGATTVELPVCNEAVVVPITDVATRHSRRRR